MESEPRISRTLEAQHPRWWHRYQHLYIWFLHGIITLRWQLLSDFMFLRRGRAGRSPVRRPKRSALVTLIAGKAVFLIWAFAIPLVMHPVLSVLVFFVLTSFVASLALTLVFQLSHCVVEATFINPAHHTSSRSWQIHQIETTVDFARNNILLHLYAGGLNYQIEHHLYSRLPHTLYPRIAPIVQAAAQVHGISYTYHTTLRQALRSHTRWLKLMGFTHAKQSQM